MTKEEADRIQANIARRIRDTEREQLLENWNLIKGWMLEMDWAKSDLLPAVRRAIIIEVERKLEQR